jgi:hypothetical protein
VTFLLIFDTVRTGNKVLVQFILLMWGVFIATNYDSTRYRIFWYDDAIKQIAVFGNVTFINTSEISRISLETSDLRTMLSLTRPLRRLAIYAANSNPPKRIDVSLKHFAADDIRRLMHAIHERRPELSIPKEWR